MTVTKEQLELAAYAINIDVQWLEGHPFGPCMFRMTGAALPDTTKVPWRPDEDPGDALNLIARMRMNFEWTGFGRVVVSIDMAFEYPVIHIAQVHATERRRFVESPEKALRHAAVAAAAEYGKKLKELGYRP